MEEKNLDYLHGIRKIDSILKTYKYKKDLIYRNLTNGNNTKYYH